MKQQIIIIILLILNSHNAQAVFPDKENLTRFSSFLLNRELAKYYNNFIPSAGVVSPSHFEQRIIDAYGSKVQNPSAQGEHTTRPDVIISSLKRYNKQIKSWIALCSQSAPRSSKSLKTITITYNQLISLQTSCFNQLEHQKKQYGVMHRHTFNLHTIILHEGLRLEELITQSRLLKDLRHQHAQNFLKSLIHKAKKKTQTDGIKTKKHQKNNQKYLHKAKNRKK